MVLCLFEFCWAPFLSCWCPHLFLFNHQPFFFFHLPGDRGAAAIAEALTVNTALTNLWFPSNAVGCQGMEVFAKYLPKMDGLEQLNVGMLLDEKAADALTTALKDNLRLSVLYMEKPVYDEEAGDGDGYDYTGAGGSGGGSSKVVDFYLRLNRSGRRLLVRDPCVSQGLWPRILSKTVDHASKEGAPDVLYYLLREKPELVEKRRK